MLRNKDPRPFDIRPRGQSPRRGASRGPRPAMVTVGLSLASPCGDALVERAGWLALDAGDRRAATTAIEHLEENAKACSRYASR